MVRSASLALDLTLVDASGATLRREPLEFDEHEKLMTLAMELRLFQVLRLQDYYADVRFGIGSLPNLEDDLRRLQARLPNGHELTELLNRFLDFVREASSRRLAIVAFAD